MKTKWITFGLTAAIVASPLPPYLTANAAEVSGNAGTDTVVFQVGNQIVEASSYGKRTVPIAPFIQNRNTIVPLKELAEGLHADIEWNPKTQEVIITKNDRTIKVRLADDQAWVGGRAIKLPVRVTSMKGKSYGPVRPVIEALGGELTWEYKTRKVTVTSESSENTTLVKYTFEKDAEGWTGGFADLPVDYNKDIYNLSFQRAAIPLIQAKSVYGLQLNGMNRSDDLFMYITKKVDSQTGLKPNTEYNVNLKFDLVTNEAGGMVGVGGSPAEAVSVKAGVIDREPKVEQVTDSNVAYYRMNIDIGNQSNEGKDMKRLGNIAKPDSSKEGYQLKTFEQSFTVKSNDKGDLYLIIGTDSGYEGLTSIYFTNIQASFEENTKDLQ